MAATRALRLHATVITCVIVCACSFRWVSGAHAQDDWDLTRAAPSRPRTATRSRPTRPEARPTGVDQQTLIDRYLSVLGGDPDQAFPLQRLLELYRSRDGNLDRLSSDLTQKIAQGRNGYAFLVVLGAVEIARNQVDAARAAFGNAITLDPSRLPAFSALANLEVEHGSRETAVQLLERAVNVSRVGEPRRHLLRTLAELALDANDFESAAKHFARLSEDGGVYLAGEYARALAEKGEHRRAVDEYERVLTRLRGDPRVLAPLQIEFAKAQLAAGDVDEAIATLEAARKLSSRSGVSAEIDEVRLDAYRRSGRLTELVDELQRRAKRPNDHALLGRICDETGQTACALAAYRRALAGNRNAFELRLRVIALLSREGRLDDVIGEYRALIRVAPNEPRFVTELAQLLMETGKRTEALSMLARAAAQHPTDARLHEALAQLYARWQEPDLAAAELTLLTRIAPNDPMHLIVLGEQQIEQGNRDAALETWRRIVRVSESKAKAHLTLAGLLADHDMLNEAVAEYREALKLAGDDLAATRGLAETLERLRRDPEAAVQWERVLDLAESDRGSRREARRRLIALWARANQLRERLADAARRFSITGADPRANDTEAGRFLAEGYDRLARDGAAQAQHFRALSEQVSRRIVALEPADIETLTALEQLLAARGDIEGAIAMLERLVLVDPPRARSYLARMANHALQLYRDDQAIAYAQRSVALNSDDAQAHERLGELFRARQDIEHAINAYERAVALNERLFEADFVLAELYQARGQTNEADRHLRRVMRASPDDELVARATRASMQLHVGDGSLEALEAELLPLALGHPQRPVFRRLVVELYDALTQPLSVGDHRDDPAQVALAKRAIKPLLEALADQDPGQRETAVRILGQLNHPSAAVPLLALAESDGDMDLRRDALLAVGRVAGDELAPRLATLAAGSHRRLRDVAAWALARMGTRASVAELGKLLGNSLPVVRAYAALGVGASDDPRWSTQLSALVNSDRSPLVRSAAALALANTGGATAIAALTASVRGQDEQASATSIVALGVLAQPATAPILADALFHSDRELQRRALWALSQLGNAHRKPAAQLILPPSPRGEAELWSPDTSEVGWTQLQHIALRFPDALLQAIHNALHGARETTRVALRGLLDALDHVDPTPTGKNPLVAYLLPLEAEIAKITAHPDREVRVAALTLLSRIESPLVDAAIDAALHDPETSVRGAALHLLSDRTRTSGTADLAQLLVMARQSSAWSMRLQAVEALGKHGGREACAALVNALAQDDYAYVREQAARWIGTSCPAEAVAALASAKLHDPEPRVRAAATAALVPR